MVERDEAREEVARLRACVQHHHDQRGDNRCHLDDGKLYHDALGIGADPYACALPPTADMEESCRRYIRQRRCPGPEGVVPLPGDMTIQQLTDEVTRIQARESTLIEALESAQHALKHAATSLRAIGFSEANALHESDETDETGMSADEYGKRGVELEAVCSAARAKVQAALSPPANPSAAVDSKISTPRG